MADEEGPDEGIELAVTDYVKLKVPGVITKALFGSSAAVADTRAALGRSAAAKIATGVPLHPDEQIVHDLLMAPLRKKAARLLGTGVRAAEIIANEPKLLPGHVDGQQVPEPQAPDEAWSERHADGASQEASPDVREMWARILAGEVTKPGSFSFKTLSVLKDTDTASAQAFTRLLAFAFDHSALPPWEEFVQDYESASLPYTLLLELNELGLINIATSAIVAEGRSLPLNCRGAYGFVIPEFKVNLKIMTLTRAGSQLSRIADVRATASAIRAQGEWLKRNDAAVKLALPSEQPDRFVVRDWSPEVFIFDEATATPSFAR